MTIEYRVLGSLEVTRGGAPVDLGSPRQRALLAFLLMRSNTVVSTDRLIDELWRDSAAKERQNALWVYISNLRSALEPNRKKRTDGTVLLTRSPGYVLRVEPGQLDAETFERQVSTVRATIETDPAEASLLAREALALWRGHAYEEFRYEIWAGDEIHRLEELRLQAIELRIEADLRHGAGTELIAELEALRREHPVREPFAEQLMLALYRSGRTVDALGVFRDVSSRLGQDLGIEPGQRLRRLEERIVTGDPMLEAPHAAHRATTGDGLTVRGYEIRGQIGEGTFGVVLRAYQPAIGREVAIKVIRPELANDPSFIRRFESEAQLVARLEHPHIVPLYDYWREPGAAYLVMRMMRGSTLESLLLESALDGPQAAIIVDQLSRALAAAHEKRVFHRDIKPANVLLDDDRNAYLSDFGVAIGGSSGGPPADVVRSTLDERYAPPETFAGDGVGPQTDIYGLAVVMAQALTGITAGYQQIRGGLPAGVVTVLDRATAPRPADRYPDVRAFGEDLVEALGRERPDLTSEPDAAVENPYKGLRSFSTADAGDFFGRDRVIDRLVGRLGDPGPNGRFIAVVGPSGSGKSSVVKAGLIPAVHGGAIPGASSWFVAQMTPGVRPFESLETALLSVAVSSPPSLLEMLHFDGIAATIDTVVPDEGHLLLVIDQFEEIFTLTDDEHRDRFIDQLVHLATDRHARVRVIITLRADFYDRPLRKRPLGELLRTGTELITPMSREELEQAIEGPAGRVGISIDHDVVHAMIDEAIDEPGALPLLQYTLTELFDRRSGSTISMAEHQEIGGVSGSLVRRADSILARLGHTAAETARQVFLRLVTIGEEGSSDTRRRALVSELRTIGDPEVVDTVLESFGRRRLLSFDRDPVSRSPTVEIAHESLLTEWGRFAHWIDDARDDLRLYRGLRVAVLEWEESGRDEGYLLTGARLARARAWAGETSISLSRAERDFVEFSVHRQDRLDEEEAQRVEETERARTRAARRTKQLSVVGVVSVVVAAIAGFAFDQRSDAVQARTDLDSMVTSLQLADESTSLLSIDPELSALLAVEAVKVTAPRGFATPDAIDAVHWSLHELGVTYPVDESTPAYVRRGPKGAVGVWGLPVDALTSLALDAVAPRSLTAAECERFAPDLPCPTAVTVGDTEVLGGIEAYASSASFSDVEVLIRSPMGDDEFGGVLRSLQPVADDLGISIRHESAFGPGGIVEEITTGGDGAVFMLAQPGFLPRAAQHHRLLDLSRFVDPDQLEAEFGTYLVSLSRLGTDGRWPSSEGPVFGVFGKGDVKSLIWINTERFEETSASALGTWDDFEQTVLELRSSELAPICFGLDSPGYDGWPGTDLIENWVLRSQGVEFYDDWVAHRVPFDHPAVIEAIAAVGRLFLSDGVIDGGAKGATRRGHTETPYDLWANPSASCVLAPGGSFLPTQLVAFGPDDVEPAAGVREFPVIDHEHSEAILGAGTLSIAVEDRPEVRAIMALMASREWGEPVMAEDAPAMIPLNARFDRDQIANPAFRIIHESVSSAVTSDSFRFDGSDQMPPEIGGDFGAFLEGMLRLFREGTVDNVDELAAEIAADIEATWAALESDDGPTTGP